MSKQIESQGQYKNKEGSQVSYEFTYTAFDNMTDALEVLGEDKALKCIQRMTKVDANNTSREKAKVANGDSTHKAMTEEQKAEGKAKRAEQKLLMQALMANPELLAQVQGAI